MAQLLPTKDFTEYLVRIAKKRKRKRKRNNLVMQHTETKDELRAKLKNALDELVETQEQNSTLYEVIRVLTGRIQHLEKLAENELHTFANS